MRQQYLSAIMRAVIALIALTLICSCEGGTMRQSTWTIQDPAGIPDALKQLSGTKVYFGHQSVGYNILDGIRDLQKGQSGAVLSIVESTDAAALAKGSVLMHAAVGQNADPNSKLRDFEKQIEGGIGNRADIAFVKFCYVDIGEGTDTSRLFEQYRETMSRLKVRYPSTTFVHLTVPLTSKQTDIVTLTKNVIKRIIGKPVRTYRDNIGRDRFNAMLRKEYGGKEPLFDLAVIESTLSDGQRVIEKEGGIEFPSLAPVYTSDGGHLNEQGRRMVAGKLLLFLADVSGKALRK